MSFDAARAIFNTVDTNRDGTIDRQEFQQFVGSAGSAGGAGGYGASWGGSYGSDIGLAGSSSSVFESSGSYGSGAYGSGAFGAEYAGAGYSGASSYDLSSAGYGAGGAVIGGGNIGYNAGAAYSSQSAQVYATDAQGLYQDPNPQIIRRPAPGGVQTYTQNIRVRFLQPPPVPAPGPLIIKEVRPPQPPVPPPLRIRQVGQALPQPPPLVLRERPPHPPPVIASQTIIRRLPGLPVPPRSVIIERLPPLPPRPRDIIIERWVPYGPQAKRRTIVQRAAAVQPYPAPRNIIIQYEPAQVRVVRQFQRLGVSQASPAAYAQQYGLSLLDSASLLAQARAAGVVEDISPPAVSVGYTAATYGQELGGLSSSAGWESGYSVDAGLAAGGSGYEASYSSGGAGFGGAGIGGSFAYGGGLSAGYGAGFESSSSSFESYGGLGGIDVAGAAFNSVDTNHDGLIDRNEFQRFFQQGL